MRVPNMLIGMVLRHFGQVFVPSGAGFTPKILGRRFLQFKRKQPRKTCAELLERMV